MLSKHIKKKFLKQDEKYILKDGSVGIEFNLNENNQKLFKSNYKSGIVKFTQKETENDIYGVICRYGKGNHFPIPIPDFSLAYFNYAYLNNSNIKEVQRDLIKKLHGSNLIEHDCEKELYSYFGQASSIIIMLFSAVESFANYLIPEDAPYIDDNKILYDKDEIQKKLDIIDKFKKVIAFSLKMDFFNCNDVNRYSILELRNLRNELVHLKHDLKLQNAKYIIEKLINFNYDRAIQSVADLMNFYKPGYVEPCDCEADF